jgi:hypothetical protein
MTTTLEQSGGEDALSDATHVTRLGFLRPYTVEVPTAALEGFADEESVRMAAFVAGTTKTQTTTTTYDTGGGAFASVSQTEVSTEAPSGVSHHGWTTGRGQTTVFEVSLAPAVSAVADRRGLASLLSGGSQRRIIDRWMSPGEGPGRLR